MMTKIADIPQYLLDIYGRKILMEAQHKMYFMNLIDRLNVFGKEKGDRVKFPVQDYLTSGGKLLDEDSPIPKQKMTGSEVFVGLEEFGNAVTISRRSEEASFIPILEQAKKLLVADYREVFDRYLRDQFFETANKYYADAKGVPGADIADTESLMTGNVIDTVMEQASDLRIPKFQGNGYEFYVMVCDNRTIRQLRAEPKGRWLDARIYTDPKDIIYGTTGMYEGIVFLETGYMKEKVATGAGEGGEDVHKSLLIGQGTVGFAEALPMGLYPVIENEEFRKTSLAWYTIAGAGILQDHTIEVNTLDGIPT